MSGDTATEGRCYWHLVVGRGQGQYERSYNAQDSPPTTKNYLVQNVNSAEVVKFCCRKHKLTYSDRKSMVLGIGAPRKAGRKGLQRTTRKLSRVIEYSLS